MVMLSIQTSVGLKMPFCFPMCIGMQRECKTTDFRSVNERKWLHFDLKYGSSECEDHWCWCSHVGFGFYLNWQLKILVAICGLIMIWHLSVSLLSLSSSLLAHSETHPQMWTCSSDVTWNRASLYAFLNNTPASPHLFTHNTSGMRAGNHIMRSLSPSHMSNV